MSTLQTILDLFLHLDRHLIALAGEYGLWIYVILFLVVFCETGLVVTPFLPGDSLLFATGVLAATGALSVAALASLLTAAAILGDSVNFEIGHRIGRRLLAHPSRVRARRHLERTERFYARHGGKTIVLARFAPILRTFAPFVAGLARMRYRRFLAYNVVGGVLWIGLFLFGGYFFGGLPVVRKHFGVAVVAIVAVSLLPALLGWARGVLGRGSAAAPSSTAGAG